MLRNLLESQAAPNRRFGGTVVSIALHTAAIGLAVAATARATSSPPPASHEHTDVIYTPPPAPAQPKAPVCCPVTTIDLPPVRRDLVPPVDIPSTLPPIDMTARPTEWAEPYHGLIGGPPGQGVDAGLASPTNAVYRPELVEKVAAPRPGNPAPIYPPALRSAQIEGSVIARFVVDTSGRAEPESITFTEVSQVQFADAVRQSLLRSRYLPAMIGGRAVRQLVEQRFEFSLRR
jgi:protein TonB